MDYISVARAAEKWGVSERSVRNYCAHDRISGAVLEGKTWKIPSDTQRPERLNKRREASETLLDRLREEKKQQIKGGIYHKVQIELTYNSNHMEGSRLTHDQTRFIYETNTIGTGHETANVDDIVEAANHFKCIDLIIEQAQRPLSESFIKQLHLTLKSGTSDSRKEWFAVGDYKKLPNEVGGKNTAQPEEVAERMQKLLRDYHQEKEKTLKDLIEFHYRFECIHPFQDGNGRVGRLILFKECLRNQIVPFIIDENLKLFYYRGLQEWKREEGYLMDTCLTAQDRFKVWMDYFRIPYRE